MRVDAIGAADQEHGFPGPRLHLLDRRPDGRLRRAVQVPHLFATRNELFGELARESFAAAEDAQVPIVPFQPLSSSMRHSRRRRLHHLGLVLSSRAATGPRRSPPPAAPRSPCLRRSTGRTAPAPRCRTTGVVTARRRSPAPTSRARWRSTSRKFDTERCSTSTPFGRPGRARGVDHVHAVGDRAPRRAVGPSPAAAIASSSRCPGTRGSKSRRHQGRPGRRWSRPAPRPASSIM